MTIHAVWTESRLCEMRLASLAMLRKLVPRLKVSEWELLKKRSPKPGTIEHEQWLADMERLDGQTIEDERKWLMNGTLDEEYPFPHDMKWRKGPPHNYDWKHWLPLVNGLVRRCEAEGLCDIVVFGEEDYAVPKGYLKGGA